MKARGAVLASAVVALLAVGTAAHAASGYAYSVVGNPADVTTPTSGLLVLQGGGTDVDENFVRMGARSGSGAFLARLVNDGWTTQARAIAAGRETALHVNPVDGTAEVFTTPTHPTPYVYFLRTNGPPQVCSPETPLTYSNVSVYRIGPGGGFDIDTWSGTGGISYTLSATAGVLTSSNGSVS